MFNKVINFKFIVYIFTFLLNHINFIWNDKSIHTHHVHIKDYTCVNQLTHDYFNLIK